MTCQSIDAPQSTSIVPKLNRFILQPSTDPIDGLSINRQSVLLVRPSFYEIYLTPHMKNNKHITKFIQHGLTRIPIHHPQGFDFAKFRSCILRNYQDLSWKNNNYITFTQSTTRTHSIFINLKDIDFNFNKFNMKFRP